MRAWPRERVVVAVLLLLIAMAAVGHQLWWRSWFIEDAAISFAYTKHLVEGHGLVVYPGGERVEGYSNFTWVLLLAPFQWLGLSGFESAKPVAGLLTMLTVPLVYLIAREVDDRPRTGIFAAIALAAHSQVAHYAASGLENALFSFLLALGIWRTAVEVRTRSWPWAALAFAVLAATRPEAILYGATAGFLTMLYTLGDRRGVRPTLAWLATFFVPWGAYQAWRYWYFAWLFPQTYYAKMNLVSPEPWAWNVRGWKYVRNWGHNTGAGYLLPVFVLGLVGVKRWRDWRAQAVIGASVAASLVIAFGTELRVLVPALLGGLVTWFYAARRASGERPTVGATAAGLVGVALLCGAFPVARYAGLEVAEPPVPSWWGEVPSYTLITIAALAPALALRGERWRVPVLCWALAAVGVFFAVFSQGDWMVNWRWMSLPAVPMCVLFGLGAARFGDLTEDLFTDGAWRVGWVGALTVLGLSVGAHVAQTRRAKFDIPPSKIKARVDYKIDVIERMHFREPVVDLDVDMGAHMFWFDAELHDIAGLVDIPFAQHKFARKFVQPFLYEEVKPLFAHVHSTWAKNSGIPSFPPWKTDYFELPPYRQPNGAKHPGNFMRRDAILRPGWDGPDGRRRAFGPVVLEGWDVPSDVVGVDRSFELHVGVRGKRDARMMVFLAKDGQARASWEVPLGYGWISPDEWKVDEVFHGVYDLRLPDDVAEGTYALGFAVMDAQGRFKRALNGVAPDPVFTNGEVRFPGALTVTSLEHRAAEAKADRQRALGLAASGDCGDAEDAWHQAVAHRAGERSWRDKWRRTVFPALADCWARAARELDGPDRLRRARHFDPTAPAVREVGAELGARLHAEGMTAYAAEDWETAFILLDGAAKADPSRSWSRRHAEEARAFWLGLPPIPRR